jgi:protoporphyrinogen oxidase
MFFKDYTEKIWGLPCHLISADWARQRIEGLSMLSVISSFFSKKRATSIRTLTRTFYYPPLGPGMLFEKMAEKISTGRNLILTGYTIRKIFHNGEKILKISATNHQGGSTIIEVDQIISSMPLTHFIESLQPPAPETVRNAARQLSFRNLLVVNLICANQDVFPDNWIYINSKDVLFGRIQNYKNWSPAMVPDSAKTSLGLEYFCSQTDPLWNLSKEQLFTLAKQELKKIGFSVTIDDGFIHRQSEAYPVYAMGYQEKLQTIKSYLKNFKNLQIIGRNGRFQYDNMDTSMATGLEAARKIDPLKAP